MLGLLMMAAIPSAVTQTAIRDAVGRKLADPFSAQYEWQAVRSDTLYCGWVNAKNQLGAYTGYRPFMVLYAITASGKPLVMSADLDPDIVTPMCLKEGYRLTL